MRRNYAFPILISTLTLLSINIQAQSLSPLSDQKDSGSNNFMIYSSFYLSWEKGNRPTKHLSPIKNEVEELKKRILAVQLFDETEKNYKAKNKDLKDIMNLHWMWNDSIVFLNRDAIGKLYEKIDDRYAVLEIGQTEYMLNSRVYEHVQYGLPYYSFATYLIDKKFEEPTKKQADIPLEPTLVKNYILSVCLTTPAANFSSDLIFAVQQYDYHLLYALNRPTETLTYTINENITLLKSKKLLLPKQYITDDEETISKKYAAPFEIVDNTTITKAIHSKDKNYAYLKFIFLLLKAEYGIAAIDAETGKILMVVGIGKAPFVKGGVPYVEEKATIKSKHLSSFLSEKAQLR
jgi:hypothetical protein